MKLFDNTPYKNKQMKGENYVNYLSTVGMQLESAESNEVSETVKGGELMILAVYITPVSESQLKTNTQMSEIHKMIKTALHDCGKDVRIIILPTTGESRIECIYPK